MMAKLVTIQHGQSNNASVLKPGRRRDFSQANAVSPMRLKLSHALVMAGAGLACLGVAVLHGRNANAENELRPAQAHIQMQRKFSGLLSPRAPQSTVAADSIPQSRGTFRH